MCVFVCNNPNTNDVAAVGAAGAGAGAVGVILGAVAVTVSVVAVGVILGAVAVTVVVVVAVGVVLGAGAVRVVATNTAAGRALVAANHALELLTKHLIQRHIESTHACLSDL